MIARGIGTDAAATFLGHTSSRVTEGHSIEPDHTTYTAPASYLQQDDLEAIDEDSDDQDAA